MVARHFDVYTAPPKQISQGFRNTMATCLGMPYKHEVGAYLTFWISKDTSITPCITPADT